MTKRIAICSLDLDGLTVITEAATGAYAVTAAAAARAGARVHAYAAATRFGAVEDAAADVVALCAALEVPPDSVAITTDRSALPFEAADIVTNSGVLRPIDRSVIDRLTSRAVIALMYEAWEVREDDIDLVAAADRGIEVIGVNEHHEACGAFAFVGDLAVAAARRRGWVLHDRRIGVLSDNAFAEPVMAALGDAGADVVHLAPSSVQPVDIVVCATTPPVSQGAERGMSVQEVTTAIAASDAAACIQLWGDVDRTVLAGLEFEPEKTPDAGHQGISMSAAGPEPVVRLQVGGLAAVVHRDAPTDSRLAGLAQRLPLNEPTTDQ